MPDVKFSLDDEAFARLTEHAAHEERSPEGQAKILLLKALDAYQEYRVKAPAAKRRSKPAPAAQKFSPDGSPHVMNHG